MDERYSAYLDALSELASTHVIQLAEREIWSGSSPTIEAAMKRYGETKLLNMWQSVVAEMRQRQIAKTRDEARGCVPIVGEIFELDADAEALREDFRQMRFLYDRHIGFLPESVEQVVRGDGIDEAINRSSEEYAEAELACAKALTAFEYMMDAGNVQV